METKKKKGLHQAMIKVMQEVKSIDKNTSVGSGNYGYKGVSDKDVKQIIGQSMSKNELTCVPIKIEPTVRVDRWGEENEWNGKVTVKQKQSVFTEVLVTYQITHAETGESIQVMGYGHGQDAMDKSAGKATTYALKNALLYSFLVPTGAIDDTDKTHSNDIQTPQPKAQPQKATVKPTLVDDRFDKVFKLIEGGEYEIETLKNQYDLTKDQLDILKTVTTKK